MYECIGAPEKETVLFLPEGRGIIYDTPKNALKIYNEVAELDNDFWLLYEKDKKGNIVCYLTADKELLWY